jgi:hypothetical protein
MKSFLLQVDYVGLKLVGGKPILILGFDPVPGSGLRFFWRLDRWAQSSDGKLLLMALKERLPAVPRMEVNNE